LLLPALQPKENWEITGRWNAVDVLFKLPSQHGTEYALGPTHEEIIAPLSAGAILSYRDLPLSAYQIQTKFRDEARAKSGLLRGREFRMKDMYSFHASQEDLDSYYAEAQQSYVRIFSALGLKAILTEASGGSFSKYSHEYQVETEAGEDTIYICEKCGLAKNKEVYSGTEEVCTDCGPTTWRETQSCEVGNIFKLGTKFTAPFAVSYLDAEGQTQIPVMGCYGIGTTRLMGVIAEISNDANGLVWPAGIAPFVAHIIRLSSKDEAINAHVAEQSVKLYDDLNTAGISVLLDDRDESAGSKFKDADLIGIPWRIVVSEKTLASDAVELKPRTAGDASLVPLSEITERIGR
jgi:prolyl-tRNA synthetase